VTIANVGTPTTSITGNVLNKVTGVAQNHLMLTLLIDYDNNAGVISAPAGWLVAADANVGVTNQTRAALYYKVAGTGEPSSYTWSVSGAAFSPDLAMAAYSGVDTGSPFDATPVIATGSSSTPTIGGITTATDNARIVLGMAGYTNDAGAVTGMTALVSALDGLDYLFDEVIAAHGATGSLAATNTSDRWIMLLLALKPSSGAVQAQQPLLGVG
jgi:hypothetical protein